MQEYWTGLPCPSLWGLPNPGIKPRSPALQVDSLPSEPPGKPINAGVGSLSLLQEIFPTQELNWGILHCRWILYLLSCQRNLTFEGLGPLLRGSLHPFHYLLYLNPEGCWLGLGLLQ